MSKWPKDSNKLKCQNREKIHFIKYIKIIERFRQSKISYMLKESNNPINKDTN